MTKFHWKDGLCFTRQPNGDVLIEKLDSPENLPPLSTFPTGVQPAVEATVLIPAEDWPVICNAVGKSPSKTFQTEEKFRELHLGKKPAEKGKGNETLET